MTKFTKYNIYAYTSMRDACINGDKYNLSARTVELLFNNVVSIVGHTSRNASIFDFHNRSFDLCYLGNLADTDAKIIYNNICKQVANCDFCIIQASTALPAYKDLHYVFEQCISNNINASTLGMHEAYVAMHIYACAGLNKHCYVYTFDPFYMHTFNQHVFGFSDDAGMTYLPLLEQSIKNIDMHKFDTAKLYRFMYSAKLFPRTLENYGKSTSRNALHKSLFEQATKHDRLGVEFDDAMHSIGQPIEFDESKYLQLLTDAKFTLLPPNISSETMSIKRGIDAIKSGCCPVIFDDSLQYAHMPETWSKAIRIKSLHELDLINTKQILELVDDLQSINIDDYFDKYYSLSIPKI